MSRTAAAVRFLRTALDATAALLLAAVVVVTAARVAGRYVLGLSMPWSEELTRLLFIWLVMVGAARSAHLRIDLFRERLAPAPRRLLDLVVGVVSLSLLVLLVRYGLSLVELTAYDRYTALGISVQYAYWALVIGASFWMVGLVLDLVPHRRGRE
ncbi:MAG: TRAP transporter small permease [Pseudomonadota bacterium]